MLLTKSNIKYIGENGDEEIKDLATEMMNHYVENGYEKQTNIKKIEKLYGGHIEICIPDHINY